MQSTENTTYEDVCTDVGRELQSTASAAIRSGIEPWRIIPDPGEQKHLITPNHLLGNAALPKRVACRNQFIELSFAVRQKCLYNSVPGDIDKFPQSLQALALQRQRRGMWDS